MDSTVEATEVYDDINNFEFELVTDYYSIVEYTGVSTRVKIPDGVTRICGHTFRGCSKLESVTIPNSVKIIHPYVFENCVNLTFYCEAEAKPDGWDEDWNYSNCPVVWGYKR